MHAKMLEVCSTTLPQRVLPEIFENEDFKIYNQERREKYSSRAETA
jgi:ribosome maturation protein Sdo1